MTRLAAVVLGCLVAGVAIAQPAPNTWSRITGPKDSAANEVTFARARDGVLHVAWLRAGEGKAAVLHTIIAADGTPPRREPQPAVDGWKTLSVPALLLERDGSLRLLFGGVLGTLSTSEPRNAGSLYSATAGADAAKWSVAPGKLSDAENVYVGPVAAAINADGTIASAWAASDTLQVQLGLGTGRPRHRVQQSCCPYQPGLGVDGTSGEIVLGWYSNDRDHLGLNAQVVSPAPKDPLRVPGTVVPYGGQANSTAIDQKVPVSGRIGAPGVYVAYCAGYPSLSSVNLWRYGDPKPVVVAKLTTGRTASVAAAPEGRLWVMWANAGRFFAVRSNKAVSRFSAPIAVAPPARLDAIYRVTGEGSPGPLDLFAHVATPDAGPATWHTRVYPVLTVTATPRSVAAAQGGTVTIVVTDVGDPVRGAQVRVGGATLRTGADGKITFDLQKRAKAAAMAITADADGYTQAKTTVTVK